MCIVHWVKVFINEAWLHSKISNFVHIARNSWNTICTKWAHADRQEPQVEWIFGHHVMCNCTNRTSSVYLYKSYKLSVIVQIVQAQFTCTNRTSSVYLYKRTSWVYLHKSYKLGVLAQNVHMCKSHKCLSLHECSSHVQCKFCTQITVADRQEP